MCICNVFLGKYLKASHVWGRCRHECGLWWVPNSECWHSLVPKSETEGRIMCRCGLSNEAENSFWLFSWPADYPPCALSGGNYGNCQIMALSMTKMQVLLMEIKKDISLHILISSLQKNSLGSRLLGLMLVKGLSNLSGRYTYPPHNYRPTSQNQRRYFSKFLSVFLCTYPPHIPPKINQDVSVNCCAHTFEEY